jgi:hypothetical protein
MSLIVLTLFVVVASGCAEKADQTNPSSGLIDEDSRSDLNCNTITGFTGEDISLKQISYTDEEEIKIKFEHKTAQPAEINSISIDKKEINLSKTSEPGKNQTFYVESQEFTEAEKCMTHDIAINYNMGILENIEIKGSATTNFAK